MRNTSTELFQLIKSLDRNEKGYFKKYALLNGSQGNSNNYIRLFDAIDAMKEYNEAELKKKFKGEKFIVQLHVTKNYLYNTILKSLRSYSSKSNDHQKILAGIQDAEILTRKGHYEKALQLIRSTRTYAFEREFWSYATELIEMERLIHNIHTKTDSVKSIGEINSERAQIIDILKHEQGYIDLSYKSKTRTFQHGHYQQQKEQKKFADILKEKLFDPKDEPRTVYAKNLASTLKLVYYSLTDNEKKYYDEASSGYRVFSQHAFAVHKNPYGLYNKAFNLGVTFMKLRKYNKMNALLQEMSELHKTHKLQLNPRLRGMILEKTMQVSIVYYINSHQFEKGMKQISSTIKALELDKKFISTHSVNNVFYFSAAFYIMAGYLKQAVKSLNQVLVFNPTDLHPDIKIFSKYLLLIAHYELQHEEMLHTVNALFEPGESVTSLDFLRTRLLSIQNRKDEISAFSEFKKTLLASNDRNMIDKYFDFEAWAESKIQNKPFSLILQSRQKQEND